MRYQKRISIALFNLILLSATLCFSQLEEFAQHYDVILTIAGKGDIDDKAENGWKSEFEGGPAVEAELSRPHFAMADNSGIIYIADKDAHAIRKIEDGRIYTAAGTSIAGDDGDGVAAEHQLSSPNGLWVRGDGTFYILDLGNSKIRKVATDGFMETLVDDPDGISLGRGLWVSDDENTIYYSSGNKIKKWTRSDGLLTYASGFSALGNLVVDPTGYVVATYRGADVVYRVFEDGSKTVIAGNGSSSGGGSGFPAGETGIDGVRGIWFFADMSYLLATHEGSQIWFVDNSGIIHLFLDGKEGDEYHSGDGQHFRTPGYKISEARSVSVDYQGNILIAENDRGFIRKIVKKTDVKVEGKEEDNRENTVVAFPNPFNSTIKIQYNLMVKSNVQVEIYHMLGDKITTLIHGVQPAGNYEAQWDATRSNGLPVNSGTYFYRIKKDNNAQIGKILYVK